MKKIYYFFLVVALTTLNFKLQTSNLLAQGAWTQKADFGGTARRYAVGFSIGTKGYIGTGSDGTYKKDFWEWDQSTNTWTQKADFGGTARYGAVGFSIGTKGYIGTGYDGTTYKYDFWMWDQVANTWTAKANCGSIGRRFAVGFSIGKDGYIGTGYKSTSPYYTADFWKYDTTANTWTQKTDFGGTARRSATGFSIGSKGYIGTGYDGTAYKSDFYEYDTTSNTWTQKANFGAGTRSDAVAFSIGAKGYVGTGYQSAYKNDFWEYSPVADTWTQKANFSGVVRNTATGFSIGTKGYIGTGYDGTYKIDFYEYDRCATLTATTSKTDATCGLNDGTASITPTGGTSPYIYAWSTSETTSSITGLAGGIYSVTVTDDNGCTVTASITVGLPAAPTIISVTPLYAYAGEIVTITGTRFGTNPALDVVIFGRVRAAIVSGNDSTLTVIVPSGASHQFVYVTNNCGQTAFSPLMFVPKFYCSTPTIAASTFAAKVDFPGPNGSYDIASADFDGDGKTDLAVSNNSGTSYFMVYRNTSAGDTISFASAQQVSISPFNTPQYIAAGDIDGDGKQDIVVASQNSNRIFIYQNTSTPGNISFAQANSYSYNNPYAPAIADMDMDGKADILIPSGSYVYALRNTGKVGLFTFLQKTFGMLSGTIFRLAIGDLDGDDKPDVSVGASNNSLYVLKNNSTIDNFSSTTLSFLYTGGSSNAFDVELGDLNYDGKLDVAAVLNSGNRVHFFPNMSTPGNISFASSIIYSLTSAPRRISIGDINSDNLPDIAVGYSGTNYVSVIKNNNNFSFASSISFTVNTSLQDVLLTDLNNNGKPDLIATNNGSTNAVSTFKNVNLLKTLIINTSVTDITCEGNLDGTATATVTNGTAPLTYQWSNGQSSNPAIGLAAGTYNVTATDSLGCIGNTSGANAAVIKEPTKITITTNAITHVDCYGASTGAINISLSGGTTDSTTTPVYEYLWSNGATSQDLSNISAGTYGVTVNVLGNGSCTYDEVFVVTQNPQIVLSTTYGNTSCSGVCNGNGTVFPSGGVSPYTYLWSGGGTSSTKTGLCAGTYTVTVTDNVSCSTTSNITISQPAAVAVSGLGIQNVSCNGGNNGYITPFPSGGTLGSSENWEGVNSWTIANGVSNQWIIGTATNNGGTKSIYISNDSSSYNYNKTVNATVHFYKDFTFPSDATNITLKFDWKGMGELNNDHLKVYVVPTSIIPANGNQISSIYQIGNAQYNLQSTYATTVILGTDSLLAGQTKRLIFSWRNDGATGTEPPVSIDNIVFSNNSTMAYSYSWSNGATTQTNSNLTAGSYSVTVTDANGCVATNTSTVGQPSALGLTETHTDVNCFGASTGSINITPSGGVTPYSYLWSNGATTQDLTNISAGTYSGTVTDANGCINSGSITIAQPSAALSVNTNATNVSCNGACNGSIAASASGGTTPYTYMWSTGSTNSSIGSLCSGTYSVTVTDNKSCTTTSTVTITQPALLNSLASKTDVTCNGLCDGTVSVSSTGGTTNYTYNWNGGLGSGASKTGVCAGTYNVTTTDANGCVTSSTVTVTQPSAIASSPSQTDVLCTGASTGAIDLTVSGGTTPYSYSWSNGATTQDLTNISAGTYTGTITDANGCTDGGTVTITEPTAIAVSTSSTNATCGSSDGSASSSVTGGVTPYSYLWSNAATTQNITNIFSGAYTVTVTDANGCTKTASATVSDAGAPTVTLTATNLNCYGQSSGMATSTVTGGVTPYTYLWNTTPAQTTSSATGLSAGTYSVVVTDAVACNASTSVAITEPSQLALSVSVTNVTCNGMCDGTATTTVTGGTSPYSYLWSDGSSLQNRTGFCAGIYSVTVTDNNGCVSSTSVTISEPSVLTFSVSSSDITCNGGSDGGAVSTVSGGTTPYSYVWSNSLTSSGISNLTAGNYSVTVTDVNGCTDNASATISEPAAITLTSTGTNVSCFGGSDGAVDWGVSGGTTPYTFLHSNGATIEDISNLTAGTYNITVTDGNSCTSNSSMSVTEPPALNLTLSKTDLLCNGVCDGTASSLVSGGVTPYSYLWSEGSTTANLSSLCAGDYTIIVTDNNGCMIIDTATISEPSAITVSISTTDVNCNGGNNGSASAAVVGGTGTPIFDWSNGDTISQISNLTSQIYYLTVTDGNNCTKVDSAVISEPAALDITTFNPTFISCNGDSDGALNPAYTGGVTPYFYEWSNGVTAASLSGLGAGDYYITVTDANGCSFWDYMTLTEPATLSATISKTDVSCNGANDGTATVAASGGTSPYSYLWSNLSVFQTLSGLSGGTYSVTVTDDNSCTYIDSVTINEPAAFSISISKTDVSCNGNCDGTATASVTGGTYPYSYLWSNGQSSSSATGLCAGNYSVTITDANGCTVVENFSINNPSAITATFSSADISCSGNCDGTISTNVSGGNSPYTYLWDNGTSASSVTGLCAGTYNSSVTITDANGCSATFTDSSTITEPSTALSVSVTKNNGCNSMCNGNATVTATGGVSPYLYDWSNGDTTNSISNLCANIYTVTVTDAVGCTAVSGANISQSPTISLSFFKTDVNCFGGNDGTASVSVSGGTPSYNYLWSNGANSGAVTNLTAGTYDLTVTDANGCSTTGNITLISPTDIVLSFSVVPANCGSANGSATATVSGGTGPYTYLWSTGQTTASANNLAGGNYFLTVTDNKGCKEIGTVNVGTTSGLTASFTSTNILCSGINNGTATITPSGGTSPFVYLWSNGQNTQTLTGLSSGTYSGTVTDNTGCAISGTVQISQPPAMNLTLSGYDASGCGSADGSIDAFASGGVSPYIFTWSNGDSTQNISNLSTGNYSVTVIDANGCSKTKSVLITAPSTATLSFTKTDATCNSACNGTAIATASGGTSPYSYMWNNGNNSDAVGGLCAGTYFVTVVDSAGCATSDSVTISQPVAISINLTLNNSSCGVDDGSAVATASGGNSPYNYQWSNGDTISSADSLGAGIYTVTVTDANACSNFAAATLSDAGGATVTINSVTQVSCNGGNNGAININVTGGTAPYSYLWSNGFTSQDISNLPAGPYEVNVTDAAGCVTTQSISVVQPPAMSVSVTATNATCGSFNGGAIINTTGGTSPYSYLWSNGATTSSVSALASGIYTVTITDNNGCTISATAPIAEIGGPVASIDSIINPGCGGTGSIYVSVTDGTSPYLYSWSNGLTSEDLVGVGGGTYSLLVTDANGCKGALTADIIQQQPATPEICLLTVDTLTGTNRIVWQKNFGIGIASYNIYRESSQAGVYQLAGNVPFDSLSAFTDSVANPLLHSWRYKISVVDSCGNESPMSVEHKTIHLTVNQGLSNTINLIWDHYNGFAYPTYFIWRYKPQTGWTVLDSLQSTLTSYTDFNPPTPYGLQYFIEVEHPNGCTAEKSENHNSSRSNKSFPIAPPPNNLTASATSTDASQGNCDGTATVTASGGILPYSYLWSDGQTTQTASGLCTGNYSCTVTDSEGDTTVVSATVNQTGSNLSASATATDAIQGNCDGTATVTASGGVSPYTYLWSDPLSQNTATATGLCAGTYTVTVTDSLGNTVTATATVSVQPGVNGFMNEDLGFRIYPNPNRGDFNVQISGYENVRITIYNVIGEKVYSTILTTNNEQLTTNLPSGIYFLQLISEKENSLPVKIIVE